MFIREDKVENIFKKPKPKNPSEISCDSCGAEFTRDKGRMDPKRVFGDYNHICDDCGPSASTRIGIKNQRERLLKEVPLGTVRKSWGEYPVVFIGYDELNDSRYSKNGGSNGWVRQHTYVMENHLGRKLNKGEVVHHIDGDKTNNDLANLCLLTVKEHNKAHAVSEELIFELVKHGFVNFDIESKRYVFNDKMKNLL